MCYFDIEAITLKPVASLAPVADATQCYCAKTVGSKLYVAGFGSSNHCIYCYDIERNVWEEVPHSCGKIEQLCMVDDYMYALPISSNCNQVPQRYCFDEQQWQSFAKVGMTGSRFFNSGATVLNSKVFVLYGKVLYSNNQPSIAVLHCFDPVKNFWEERAATCQRHFQSSLLVVNSRLYVAGGKDCCDYAGRTGGNFASIEVYDEENNKWSVVDQKHIPANNLGAVEIEGESIFHN